ELALEVGLLLLGAIGTAAFTQIAVDRLGEGGGDVRGIGHHGDHPSTWRWGRDAEASGGWIWPTARTAPNSCALAVNRRSGRQVGPAINRIVERACRPHSALNRRPRVSCCAVSPEVRSPSGAGLSPCRCRKRQRARRGRRLRPPRRRSSRS